MRPDRHTALGGARQLGGVGALGVVAAGALCAAVLSVVGRVPPSPINGDEIPEIQIGSAAGGSVIPLLRRDGRAAPRRAGAGQGSTAGDGDSGARRGGPRTVAPAKAGGGPKPDAVAAPRPSGGVPEHAARETGPAGGSPGGPVPGAGDDDRAGGGRDPAQTGRGEPPGDDADDNDDETATEHAAPAPQQAPAAAPPAGGGEPAGDDEDPPAPSSTGTATAKAGDDEGVDNESVDGEGGLDEASP
jgi:hypothetical protein